MLAGMILLVSGGKRAPECGERIRELTGEPVVVTQNIAAALPRLRASSFSAVIFDHHLVEAEPLELDTAIAHLGNAVSIEINFALMGIDRAADETQSALLRRRRNQSSERAAAARELRENLNDSLTTLLLNCDLAGEIPDLGSDAAARLGAVRDAAHKLRKALEMS